MRTWQRLILAALACGCGDDDAALDASFADASGLDGGAADAASTGGWQTRASLTGGPRQEHSVVALDGEIYVLGGFNSGLAVVPEVEAYDPVTDTWREVAPLPVPLHHLNAAVAGGKIYVLGGMSGLAFTPIASSFVYDPEMDSWSTTTPMPDGSVRGSAAVGVIGDVIYLAGGLAGSAVDTFSSFDPASETWTDLPPLPEARDHLVGAAVADTFYAIGGRDTAIGAHTDRVDAFSLAQGLWQSRAPMPTGRGGAAAAVVGDMIIVVGGEGNADDPNGVFHETEAYFPVTDEWMILPNMKTPRHGMGAAGLGAVLYVPGGATQQAFGAVATHEAYVL